jgi:hypothetical protein
VSNISADSVLMIKMRIVFLEKGGFVFNKSAREPVLSLDISPFDFLTLAVGVE